MSNYFIRFKFFYYSFFGLFLFKLFITQHNTPIFDEWEQAVFINKFRLNTLTFKELLTPHNECRMPYPFAINLLFMEISNWNSFLLVAKNMILIFVFFIFLRSQIKQIFNEINSAVFEVIMCIIFMILFSFKNYETIIMSFGLCHFLSVISGFFAFWMLRKPTTKNLILAAFLTHVSMFSFITGILAWPLLIFQIGVNFNISKKLRIKFISMLTVAFVFNLGIYYFDYHPNTPVSIHTINPFKIIPFSLSILSNNFGTSVLPNSILTLFQLSSVFLSIWLLFKFDRDKLNSILFLYLFGLWSIPVALTIAYGRATEGISNSLPARYLFLISPFCVLFFISILVNYAYIKSQVTKNAISIFLVSTFAYMFYCQNKYYQLSKIRDEEIMLAKSKIKNLDFTDTKLIEKNIYNNDLTYLKERVKILKENNLSLFIYE